MIMIWTAAGLLLPAAAPAQVTVTVAPLVSGLVGPVDISSAGDGSGRLFIVERFGRIRIWDGATLLAQPFLDIGVLTTTDGERGLLGIAFHPSYGTNGRFFVHYTDLNGGNVLAEYAVSTDADLADPSSAAILLQVAQPFSNHNGGQIRFGPDGYLYMAIGDGGSGGDPQNNGQNLDTLLGKILRLDVDGAAPYAIPADNPFAGRPGARPEIWAYGLRNPWRFSFDRLTGDLFIADVGQNRFEEVDFQPASAAGGENYGWRLMEGFSCFDPPSGCNGTGDLVLPILEYDRSLGASVTGGFVYRGRRFPDLAGYYIFADFITGRIFAARQAAGGQWSLETALDSTLSISAFGEDDTGEIYLADISGAVYEISSADAVPITSPPAPAGGIAVGDTGGSAGCFIQTTIR